MPKRFLYCLGVSSTHMLLLGLFTFFAPPLFGDDFKLGDIEIVDPFSRALPPTSVNGAAYLVLINRGHKSDQLIRVISPISERAEFHTHTMEDGTMKMRQLHSVELPPHETVVFAPGGHHVMLIDLVNPLKEGDRFPMTLQFENSGVVTVEVIVKAINTDFSSTHSHDHGDSSHQATSMESQESAMTDSSDIRFDLSIQNKNISPKHRTIQVTQGDFITLHFATDEAHTLHLHGYDLELNILPNEITALNLEVNLTGRFPIEIHGSDAHHALMYLEVYPK